MRVEKKAYVVAAILSLMFFAFGVTTGLLIHKSSAEYTSEQIDALQRRVENAQLEYIYLNTMGDKLGCDSISPLIEASTRDVWFIGRELVELDNKGVGGETFNHLKREYTLLSVRAWVLNTYMLEKCSTNTSVVMYFYSIPCPDCITQGHILDDLRKNEVRDMRVFVLDYGLNEPIIKTIKLSHNITETPSLIIGNSTYTGLLGKQDLVDILKH